MISVFVAGQPRPQGSKRYVGGIGMIENNEPVLRLWRNAISAGLSEERAGRVLNGPVHVRLGFAFRRPQNHYRTGKFAHILRDNAPLYSSARPDLDKLIRAVLDAITESGCWQDDSQAAIIAAFKCYVDSTDTVGVSIKLEELDNGKAINADIGSRTHWAEIDS